MKIDVLERPSVKWLISLSRRFMEMDNISIPWGILYQTVQCSRTKACELSVKGVTVRGAKVGAVVREVLEF